MSAVKITQALQAALTAMSPTFKTVYENTEYEPVIGTPYQRVNILLADPDNNEYSNSYRELGFMQVTLLYPSLTGSMAILTRAELIRSTFYRGRALEKDGVVLTISKTPAILPADTEGAFFVIAVRIRFFANIVQL